MSVSSDVDVETALPLLKSLFTLSDSENVSWTRISSDEGYIISQLPPTPTLGLPEKCYRTEFVVNADLESIHHALKDEASIRVYDPTLNELRTLEQRGCTTLVYASYTSPSPWIVAPRDFCVRSAAVFTTREQLKRVSCEWCQRCTHSPDPLSNIRNCSVFCEGYEQASDIDQRIYLQNSVTAPEMDKAAIAVPNKGKSLVRGIIHCFGFMAFADPIVQGHSRVTNYCCVDPAGQIPKWVTSAALAENTKKLKRLAILVESAAAAARTSSPTLSSVRELSDGQLPVKHPRERQSSVAKAVTAVPLNVKEETAPNLPTTHCDRSGNLLLPVPAAETHSGQGTDSLPRAEVGVEDSMSAASLTSASPLQPLRDVQLSTPPTSVMRSSNSNHSRTDAATSPGQPVIARSLDPMIEHLGVLAQTQGWHTRHKTKGLMSAELKKTPKPLNSNDPLCRAMRVSTSISCTLDTLTGVLRSPSLFPEIDPELVRVLNTGASSSAFIRSVGHKSNAFLVDAACFTSQLRHYQFDVGEFFQFPWQMVLECTDVELTQLEEGRCGFHTPGVSAATHVWVSTENTKHCYRGVHPDSYHQHIQVRLFGVIAAAVSRSAEVVHVSQYLLFSPAEALSAHRDNLCYRSLQKRNAVEDFLSGALKWMECRMDRLRSLCEAHQCRQNQCAILPLDKQPLLQYLYRVHCAEGSRVLEIPGASWYGDVLANSLQWTGGESSPPLLVLSSVFPCSLTQLRDFMLCSSLRHRYSLEQAVHSYEELPSPPGFRAVRVEYGEESASFPWVRLTLLEAFGEVHGVDVPRRALVLSRAGVDGGVGKACGVMDIDSEGSDLIRSVDERFVDGRILCYGWVATALGEDAANACTDGAVVGLRNPGSGGTSVSREACSMRSAFHEKAREIASHHPECIAVTQYVSVGFSSSHGHDVDADGLQGGFMAEQAASLQRLRDAVCAWGYIKAD